MKILIVAAEVSPFAKVGGLADVAGSLPKDLARLGHDVRVAMPSYPMVEEDERHCVSLLEDNILVPLGDETEQAFLKLTHIGVNIPVYLVGGPDFFRESTESSKIYVSGWRPYAFFSRAVLESMKSIGWIPDVIHCNDWHTGLLPAYLHTGAAGSAFDGTSAVFTIHNLAYQGEFNREMLPQAGLPDDLYTIDGLECYSRVNFLKAGAVYSDIVNTVSEKYSREIQTCEFGCRLEGLLNYLHTRGRLRGILNGIDYSVFDPANDSRIPQHFSSDDISGKAANKAALQKQLGLPVRADVPVFGLVSRLADQKGLDLIRKVSPYLMRRDVQLVALGSGDPAYESYFAGLAKKMPDKVSANIGFNADLAQRIYAGCDLFIMPSRFEPCGLGQMIALRYGTIPVVRATGGLADTIEEFDPKNGTGNGFVFSDYDWREFYSALKRAFSIFSKPDLWAVLVRNGMKCDFSGERSARRYVRLYEDALASRRCRRAA